MQHRDQTDHGTGELATSEVAAFIAVPTLITGYFGMNVPYPGFSEKAGFVASLAIMILAALVLYIVFKRKDWL